MSYVIAKDGIKVRGVGNAKIVDGRLYVAYKGGLIPMINGDAAANDLGEIKTLLAAGDTATIQAKYLHAILQVGEHGRYWVGTQKDWDARPAQIEDRRNRLRDNSTCDRCHKHVDGNIAYKQEERMRVNGTLLPVIAYYCDGCKSLLGQIGIGEHSALDARASDTPSFEPSHPQD